MLNKHVYVIVFSFLIVSMAFGADISFSDNFESHPSTSIAGLSPDIGRFWLDMGNDPNTEMVQSVIVKSGSKALSLIRGSESQGTYPVLKGVGASSVVAEANSKITYKFNISRETSLDGATVSMLFTPYGTDYIASWSLYGGQDGGEYEVFDFVNEQVIGSGITPSVGQWDLVECVLNLKSGSNANYITGTWDLYIQLANDSKVLAVGDIPLPEAPVGPVYFVLSNYGWDQTTYWDDIVIEKMSVPYCGDENHPYPITDYNYDCEVNDLDLQIFASEWLEYTGL